MKNSILLISAACLSPMLKAQNDKPNVIFILADDLGYGDVGCYGQKIIQTPNIDSLAVKGMRFTDFYAGSTVSAPSRASLMTGLTTGHTKIRGNKEIKPEGQEPMADITTLADVFRAQGYTTGIFGKWGLGYPGSGAEPLDRGFDTFFGYNCQRQAHIYYQTHLYHNREKYNIPENANNARKVYLPDVIQKYAIDFINDAAKSHKPFFAYLTYTLPHAELNLPHDAIYEYYNGKVIPKPSNGNGYPPTPDAHKSFAAMVTKLDSYIGEVVKLVNDLGIQNNTIIIFTSDNGPHLEGGADPDYFNSNGPLRGYKRDLYEGGIREPMVLYWPGVVKPNSINNTPGAFWDFLPTFEDLFKLKKKTKTDGVSLLDIWTGKDDGDLLENRTLYWEFHDLGGRQAIRKGRWKLVVNNVDSEHPSVELYDLYRDLGEQNNIAKKKPEITKKMLKEISKIRVKSSLFPFRHD